MPMAASDVRWVEEPKIGILEQLYLPAIVSGLSTTLKHVAMPRVTMQYPEQQPKLPLNYRGVHRLNRDEEGRVKCVACYMCSTACPAHCIDIVAAPSPWPDREKYPETFVIDELRCIYCGMCEEACPVDAIELTTLFEPDGPEPGRNDVRQGKTAERFRIARPPRVQTRSGRSAASLGRRRSCWGPGSRSGFPA